MSKPISERTIRALLMDQADRAGGQRAFARRVSLSAAYVNDIMHGRREPCDAVLHTIGMCKVVRRVVAFLPLAQEITGVRDDRAGGGA